MKSGPEQLSQQEIDALLSAVHSGTVAVSPAGGGAQSAGPQAIRYNFRRPSRVSKEQLRAIQVVHEDFARFLSASLSGMMRTFIEVELEGVEQATYSEYVTSVSTPTCAYLFAMEPLRGAAVLELNPQLCFLMIDRLLGGQGLGPQVIREFTEIERAVIERVAFRAMIDLQQSWQQVGAFVFRILNLETNPQLIQVTVPNEVVIVATFRLKIGETTGGITVAYPHLLLESTISGIGAQRVQAQRLQPLKPEERARVLRELGLSRLGVRAFLGDSRITVRELLALRPGQVLRLSASAVEPVRVEIAGQPKFVGRPGSHKSRLAVEILRPVDERSDDV